MNKENCASKLVDEIILYYDARSKKHQTSVNMLFWSVRWLLTTPVCIDVGVCVPISFVKCSKNCCLYENYSCDHIFFSMNLYFVWNMLFLYVLITVLTRLSVVYTSYYPWSLGFLASTSHAKFNQNVTVRPWTKWRAVRLLLLLSLFRVLSHNESLGLRNQMDILTAAILRSILFTGVSLSTL